MEHEHITQEWVLERFDEVYPVHLSALWRLLVELRHHFDGDLDSMLILLAISVGTERDDWRVALLDKWQPKRRTRPTNTLSLSQSTGIARESVRRKLDALSARGWIVRDAKGNWEPTLAAAETLQPATLETVEYLRRIFAAGLGAKPASEA